MNKEQKDFHSSRRKEFSRLIGKDSIAVIFGSTHKNKSYDADFNFSQYRNFYYLTGFNEANSALVLAPSGIKINVDKKIRSLNEVLYVQKKDPLAETWNGKRVGTDNEFGRFRDSDIFSREGSFSGRRVCFASSVGGMPSRKSSFAKSYRRNAALLPQWRWTIPKGGER